MKIVDVRVEYLRDPIGIDAVHPRISWTLEDCQKQVSYKIGYSVHGKEYRDAVVTSRPCASMHYDFTESFDSREIVCFFVECTDENGEKEFSGGHSFEMGLLRPEDWQASWIAGDYAPSKKKRYPVDCFRKKFTVSSKKKARLYIAAAGLYEAYINGQKVGDGVLTPGSTDPRKRIPYQTYDVAPYLQEGENEIEILLADGWYRGSIGAKGFTCVFGQQTKAIAQLEIDGETLVTDGSWDWSNDGPIRFADLKDGEVVDANLRPSYAGKARVVPFAANLTCTEMPLVIEEAPVKPIASHVSPSGKLILEFPVNVSGYVGFSVMAPQGGHLDIVMGEMLDEQGEVTLHNVQCVRKKKRTPLQEIHYDCQEGQNDYRPRFYYGGFRYASVSANFEVKPEDFFQIAIHTQIEVAGEFSCSNPLINIFHENTLRSLFSNSVDIPTDCPTRERMGWTGDSQVFFESASFLTDYAAFTRKHIRDVYDRQKKNGCLPQIAPYSAEDWFMDVMNGSVGWADVGILTPYRYYQKYGDKRLLESYFPEMERYIEFMIRRCGPAKGLYAIYAKPLHLSKENRRYGVNTGQSYGEWAEPADVKAFVWTDFACPHPEESMAYTHWMLSLMCEICLLIGKTEHLSRYEEYRDGVKRAYQELVTKKGFQLDTDRQAKLVRPLHLGLLTPEQEEFAQKRLLQALDHYSWRLGTGFLSTPFILYELAKIDAEAAYRLLENEEMPGWLFMAKNNTGTIWEGWEGPKAQLGIASLNHYSKGAMVEWLYQGMLGIHMDGENHFLLSPVIGGHVSFAKGRYRSIYGTVALSWEKKDGKVDFAIEVPSNTTADFAYGGARKTLGPGQHRFSL